MKTEVRKLVHDGLVAIGWLTLMGLAAGLPAGAESVIEGRVRLASGEPVSAAQVRLFRLSDLRQLAGTTTDGTGYFALPLEATEGASTLPDRFHLGQNYPNPFNPSTIIPYQLPASTHVRLEVFNLLGQRVETLVDAVQPAGLHTAHWEGTDRLGRAVATGIYLYRLQSDHASSTRRMVLLDGQAGIAPAGPESAPNYVREDVETDAAVYGLTVTAPDIVTYIDAGFRIARGGRQAELVVEPLESAPRRKVAASGLFGDVNNDGRVDISDALIVLIYSLDLIQSITLPNNGDISLGDLNRDGQVDIADALLILTYLTDPSDPSLPEGIGEPIAPIVGTPKIYWTAEGPPRIQRANLDGTNIEDLVTSGLVHPRGLALDVAAGKMYWLDRGTDKLQRANLDGSQVEDVVTTGLSHPLSLALDVAAGKVYWMDFSLNKIERSNLNGSNIEHLVTTERQPEGLALDVAAGKMYWMTLGTDKIQRANLDGSNIEVLVATGLDGTSGLTLDLAAGKMYWTDSGTDKIQRANLDGSNIEDLVTTGLVGPEELALDVASWKMYWADGSTGKIQRANLDGSNVEDLVTFEASTLYGLALDLSSRDGPIPAHATLSPDPSTLEIFNDGIWHSFTVQAGEAVVVVANPSGTTPRVESTSFSTASNHCPPRSSDSQTRQDGEAIYLSGCAAGQATVELRRAADQTLLRTYTFSIEEAPVATTGPGTSKIYWANGKKIQRADSDGSNVKEVVAAGAPRELAVDVLDGKIYWTDQGSRKIRRADLNGSNAADVVSFGLISPVGIALDAGNGKIYWTDSGSNKIQRANLDGSQVEILVSIGLHSPEGLALDAAEGKIYWTDFGTDKIQRANLDGSQIEDIVSTGLRSPAGLALDADAGKIYWTDFGTDKIQRANLDGSQIEDIVSTGLRIAKGLALDLAAGKIYWTDSGTNKVQRANLDGSNVEDLLTGPAEAPLGLAVVSPVASLSPSPSAATFSTNGNWRSFTLQASEPVIVAVNPSGSPARMLVAESSGSSSQCPAQGEDSITRYYGQAVYLAGCGTGQGTVELRRAADQAVLRTYTITISALSKMYWTNAGSRDKIQRANLDGSDVEDLVTTGLSDPIDLALDVAGGKMYWTDQGTDKIQRANLDGSNIEDLITTGLSYPVGLALDLTRRMMYWTDLTTDKIQRANLDGSRVEDLVTSGLSRPRGITLDLQAGKMYWIDRGTDKIQRASLDGSNIEDLVTSGLNDPDRLALDLAGGKVYWTDAAYGMVQRASLGGSDIENLVTGLSEPRGIALDLAAGRIYWTDNGTDRIQSADLDGSNIQTLVTGLSNPTSIALE